MVQKLESRDNYMIGVISDTHGRIPCDVPKTFKNVDLIIHAGDIGDETVLDKLSKIAPVMAVRGNMDYGKWTQQLPDTETIEIGQIVLFVVHIARRLDADPDNAGFKAVISGHTHRPEVYEKNGITIKFLLSGNPILKIGSIYMHCMVSIAHLDVFSTG